MQGEQGQIQQVDDAVAVVVAGEAAIVTGIGCAVVIAVGTVVIEANGESYRLRESKRRSKRKSKK